MKNSMRIKTVLSISTLVIGISVFSFYLVKIILILNQLTSNL